VVFQQEVFPFQHQSQSSNPDDSSSSFLWPHSEVSLDSPRRPPFISTLDLVHVVTAPLQSEGSAIRPVIEQASDSLIPSPTSTTLHDDILVHPVPETLDAGKPPDLRRSVRSRVAPTWLKDFIQPQYTRVHQDISSPSHSHSFHSAADHPFFTQLIFLTYLILLLLLCCVFYKFQSHILTLKPRIVPSGLKP